MTTAESAPAVFDLQRLALTLVQADHDSDHERLSAVLRTVTEPEIGLFLVALADLVHHAHGAPSAEPLAAFIGRHRRVIDTAEAAWRAERRE